MIQPTIQEVVHWSCTQLSWPITRTQSTLVLTLYGQKELSPSHYQDYELIPTRHTVYIYLYGYRSIQLYRIGSMMHTHTLYMHTGYMYTRPPRPSYSYVPLGVLRYLLDSKLHMYGLVSRYFRVQKYTSQGYALGLNTTERADIWYLAYIRLTHILGIAYAPHKYVQPHIEVAPPGNVTRSSPRVLAK